MTAITMVRPIETEYKGFRFRGRLEARWAVFFDAAGIEWQYEVEGFERERMTPDADNGRGQRTRRPDRTGHPYGVCPGLSGSRYAKPGQCLGLSGFVRVPRYALLAWVGGIESLRPSGVATGGGGHKDLRGNGEFFYWHVFRL
jgi:hypothetical protein